MTMDRGFVTVASDESVSGEGCALALYTADSATLVLPTVPTIGDTTGFFNAQRPCNSDDVAQAKAARMALLQDAARRASAYSSIVIYIAENAELDVVVLAGLPSTGLLKLPLAFVSNDPCIGPDTDHHLAGTIS